MREFNQGRILPQSFFILGRCSRNDVEVKIITDKNREVFTQPKLKSIVNEMLFGCG